MNNLIAGFVVLIGALGGFYGGAKYGQAHPASASTASTSPSTAPSGLGRAGGGGGAAGGGQFAGPGGAPAVAGQIVAVSNGTITVHDRQTNKDVKVNIGNARISKTVQGAASDLTQNEAVTVTGSTGSDGVVNAQQVAVGGAGLGGGRARPSPSG